MNDGRDDLLAATPPIEAIKTLISLAASQCGCNGKVKKLGYIYIYTRVFPCASAHREERRNWSEVATIKVDTTPQYYHKMLSQILL